jgi:L-rhamnose isomerase
MSNYNSARDHYAALGVDTESALSTLAATPVSLHCWQGDDVGGFENCGSKLEGGGIQATGNYPGKARTIDELRAGLEAALSLIPGKHRLNLHACYADLSGGQAGRDEYTIAQFQSWVDWCRGRVLGMDFNPSFFSHPLASDGCTLSHADTHIGLDFFDASINRVAAWVVGARSTLKALLAALLEPVALLRTAESSGDFTSRLALMEEAKTLPLGAVWEEHCKRHGVPAGPEWLNRIKILEKTTLSLRKGPPH